MKVFIIFVALVCVCAAKPSILTYSLTRAAPIGLDGRVVDTPEVAQAKAEHAAAHFNERLRIVGAFSPFPAAPVVSYASASSFPILHGIPIGMDRRSVDTLNVAQAKTQYGTTQLNTNESDPDNKASFKFAGILVTAPYLQ